MTTRTIRHQLSRSKVLYSLIAFRICNALLLKTFFQPDEYFQSLEPAWRTAFGSESGAWITWEWRQMLRTSLHPIFFAAVYRVTDVLASFFALSLNSRSELLLAAPKVVQAVLAAFSDYYTWQLAERVYGPLSQATYGALILTICSPWQWFCSTRTLSNSIETMLTVRALHLWPFLSHWRGGMTKKGYNLMRNAFAFAALATILRPTNVVIWLVVAVWTAGAVSNFQITTMIRALLIESRAAIVSGLAILAFSVFSDRIYFRQWTFPPVRFVHFNVVQSLAVFYGRNRPDYYITEGLPLLLTTSLPFAAWGWYRGIFGQIAEHDMSQEKAMLRPLAILVAVFTATMSLISHKEVRFLYPLLPALHVLAAEPFSRFFHLQPWPRSMSKQLLLSAILLANASFAFYISQVHQRGVVDVTHFLRKEYEHGALNGENMTVIFLMPCHSTPWRSHLMYSEIDARALTCEPPIDVPIEQRGTYLDEADQFYNNPDGWMTERMQSTDTIVTDHKKITIGEEDIDGRSYKSAWPQYLVFFEQLEPTLGKFLQHTRYEECWSGFNTHWHDDSRRKGNVVVWCLQRHQQDSETL